MAVMLKGNHETRAVLLFRVTPPLDHHQVSIKIIRLIYLPIIVLVVDIRYSTVGLLRTNSISALSHRDL